MGASLKETHMHSISKFSPSSLHRQDEVVFDDIADLPNTGALPPPETLVKQAHANWLSSLRRNNNQPSPAHQDAGWQLLRAMVDQLYGFRINRYAYALHCGAGKTEAVIALLGAMFPLRAFDSGKTVLVVAQQVAALCEIKQKLINAGIPEKMIGIVHSMPDAMFASTGDQKRKIMLATHARIQRDGTLPECCINGYGKLHDLVIWDEALISTESIALTLETTLAALRYFAEGGRCPTVCSAYERLAHAVNEEQHSQKIETLAGEISPLVTEEQAIAMQYEIRAVRCFDKAGNSLKELALSAVSLIQNPISLVDTRSGNSAALMRYVIRVPDKLCNVAILDASHAIDELRQADSTIRSGTTDAMTNFKDFEPVVVIHYPVASGRDAIGTHGKALSEAVRIAKGLPYGDRVLFVTFKGLHETKLREELKSAGVPLERKMPNGDDWLNVITWGKHTSDNAYSNCKHVVLVGLHRLPREALACKLAAQRRDLKHRRDGLGLRKLELSVIAGDVMQAMNRGCMRSTNAEGKAYPMTAHIIALDDLSQLLVRAMPGLRWQTASIKEPTKATDATQRILQHILDLSDDVGKVSKQSVFAVCQVELGKDAKVTAFRKAMEALVGRGLHNPRHRWTEVGRSIQRRNMQ